MELKEAFAAYRERIKYVLSQISPAPTEERLHATTEQLMAPFERRASDGNHASRETEPRAPATST
jgi:hypothetical protein